jgi:uncharacterized protein YdaU (DUF1376 family)
LNFYKHHLGDYSKATAHLSILEHGAYLLMLHHHYATEAPLPADEAVVCRIIRATGKAEAAAVHQILAEFWTLTPDGWVNKRAVDEILEASDLRDLNREKGKLGGRPKKADSKAEENQWGINPPNPPRLRRLRSSFHRACCRKPGRPSATTVSGSGRH